MADADVGIALAARGALSPARRGGRLVRSAVLGGLT